MRKQTQIADAIWLRYLTYSKTNTRTIFVVGDDVLGVPLLWFLPTYIQPKTSLAKQTKTEGKILRK